MILVDLVSIVTIIGRSFCPLSASHHRALWGGFYVCICSGQRSASALPFHMSFHGNLWAAWHHPTACFMTSSAAALPYVKSCVFSVFLMYVMSGIGDFIENVCWWCIYKEVNFLLLILIADVFLKMLWKEQAAEVPLLEQVLPIIMKITLNWKNGGGSLTHISFICVRWFHRCLTLFGRRVSFTWDHRLWSNLRFDTVWFWWKFLNPFWNQKNWETN